MGDEALLRVEVEAGAIEPEIEESMTRLEMLKEIDLMRKNGHAIGIDGHVGAWRCEIDGVAGHGVTPMEAFQATKAIIEGKPK